MGRQYLSSPVHAYSPSPLPLYNINLPFLFGTSHYPLSIRVYICKMVGIGVHDPKGKHNSAEYGLYSGGIIRAVDGESGKE